MTRRTLLLAGMLLLLPLRGLAQSSGSAGGGPNIDLYDTFRKQVQKELADTVTDEPVIQFLQGVYKERWKLSTDEMKAAIRQEPWKACTKEESAIGSTFECAQALENISVLATEEQALRTFGRNLQRVSAAQELPMSEIPGRPFHLATDLSGIINIWRAGTGSVQQSVTGSILLRTRALTEDETSEILQVFDQMEERGIADMGLPDAVHGVVWRYQYGVRLVLGERNPRFPPPEQDDQSEDGSERQYAFRDWQDDDNGAMGWETILKEIWDKLPKDRDDFDPPLSENEVAYFLFPDEIQSKMPPGMLLWARVGGATYEPGVGERDSLGDVGIAWKYPIEPFMPSLLSIEEDHLDEPILGGRYPPEPARQRSSNDDGSPAPAGAKTPIDGRGLCSMALGQRGYLCRPLTVESEELCPEGEEASDEENVITLVSCTLEDKPTLTVAGADACREIEWKNGEQPQKCTVRFTRGPCPSGNMGYASDKQADGTISVCLDDNVNGPPLTYVQEHETVHAQQYCGLPAGDIYQGLDEEEGDALCCRLEGEAHLMGCKRMIDDGVLDGLVIRGEEVTPQTCMEMLRDASCSSHRGHLVACPSTREIKQEDVTQLIDAMGAAANPEDLPDDFETATNPETMDARVAARVRTIERQIPVCEPGTESDYKNTIGNNACFIGQCVEESLELHRLTGGRSPATVGDGAFPHDDPEMGTALATMLRSVPATTPPLPSYRPQMVMRMLEDALCQLQGMPASTPPHLCAFSNSRRLAVPLATGTQTIQSLVFSADEQRDSTLLVRQIAASLGSRIGTDMQGQYLRVGTRTLSEVVALANTLLNEMLTVHFPANMCPLSLPQ
jgi:hypothetical protein